MHDRLQALDGIQKAVQAAGHDLEAARSTLRGAEAAHGAAREKVERMESERDALLRGIGAASAELGPSYPAPGFWSLSDDALQKAAPWNGALSAMPAMPWSSRPCACTAPSSSRGLPG
jgi:hypothetical protein